MCPGDSADIESTFRGSPLSTTLGVVGRGVVHGAQQGEVQAFSPQQVWWAMMGAGQDKGFGLG